MDMQTLFENRNILVINKPSGLVVHGDGKTDEPTVVDWILEHYPEIQGVGENMIISHQGTEIEIPRPGIVHRIDRDTSGILVIAKNQESFDHLKQQFKDRLVKKTYRALVYGWVKNDSGEIDQPIGRSGKDFRMKMAGSHARGKLRDAYTEYRVIERYMDLQSKKDQQGQYQKYSLVECYPKTGRTHQIRVHLKWLNHPIVADSLYRGKRKELLGLDRTALHAFGITLRDIDNQEVSVQAPMSNDMQNAISDLDLEISDPQENHL